MPIVLRLAVACLFFLAAAPALAAVELARIGQPPVTIQEVYLQNNTHYLAIDDVLAALGLSGRWEPVDHVYRFSTPRGTVTISPGSQFLRLNSSFQTLSDRPRFLDGRLRVPEDFLLERIPNLLGEPIYYRNLDPPALVPGEEESPLDRLFAFLLRKEPAGQGGATLRGIVLDPGHGGHDAGSFAVGGEKEKTVALEVSRRLEKLLKMRLGIPVYPTRSGDYHLGLAQRFEPATRPDADALLLLHAQGSLSPLPQGINLIVRPQEEREEGSLELGEGESMRLARHLGRALRQAGLEVKGIVRAPLLPLGRGNLPTVLVELGYLSNAQDRQLLADPQNQERLAEALFAGIRSFADERRQGVNQ
ncbi:MAG: N-acetylmuramoyl-L-alanine amidase [Desulfuromonadales bacterium]|nr:N-acetylmuramoyl-L-alanine amidase [Desulfuromonadales bacterium]